MHGAGVHAGPGQVPYGVQAERQQTDPAATPGGHGREGTTQGMVRRYLVVAERQHEQQWQLGHPTHQVSEHVQAGLVGPVHVLQHADGRLGPQRRIRGSRGVGAARQPRDQVGERLGRLEHRSERTRDHQVVATADQDAYAVAHLAQERAHQAGLADARLPLDQRDRARPATKVLQRRGQLGAGPAAFQQGGPAPWSALSSALSVIAGLTGSARVCLRCHSSISAVDST